MKFASVILLVFSFSTICSGYSSADFDENEIVDFLDFCVFASEWLKDPNMLADNTTRRKTGGTATFVVASSDATPNTKAKADYVCDGTADQAQIQTAIDACPALGGKVYLTEGNFVLADQISVASKIALVGAGFSTVLDATAITNKSVIVNSDVEGGNEKIQLRHFTIKAGGASAVGYGSVDIRNTDQLWISDLYIVDGTSDGILIRNSVTHADIGNIILKDITRHGIFVGWSCAHITIHDIISENPGLEHICLETYEGGAEDWNYYITVSNCVGYNAGNNGYYTEHCKYVTWENCISDTTGLNPGFLVDDSYEVHYTNCMAKDSPYGWRVLPDTYDITIDSCVANECTVMGFSLEGVRVVLSNSRAVESDRPFCISAIAAGTDVREEIIVTNNHFYDQTSSCKVNGTNILISNNIWTESSNQGNGHVLYVYNPCNTVKILNNIFDISTTGYGIGNSNGSATNVEIRGNIGAYFITEDYGTATISSGNTSVVVSHNMGPTPTEVIVTPTSNWGNMTKFWVDTFTSSQFTINIDQDPGEDVTFNWHAKWRY